MLLEQIKRSHSPDSDDEHVSKPLTQQGTHVKPAYPFSLWQLSEDTPKQNISNEEQI
jgi:hypothetical protein